MTSPASGRPQRATGNSRACSQLEGEPGPPACVSHRLPTTSPVATEFNGTPIAISSFIEGNESQRAAPATEGSLFGTSSPTVEGSDARRLSPLSPSRNAVNSPSSASHGGFEDEGQTECTRLLREEAAKLLPTFREMLPAEGPCLLLGQIRFDVTAEEQRGSWLLPEELLLQHEGLGAEEQEDRQIFTNTPVSDEEQEAVDQILLHLLEAQQKDLAEEADRSRSRKVMGVEPAWLEQLVLRYLYSCLFDKQKTLELLQSTLAFRMQQLPVLESEVYSELRNVGACYWHGRDRRMRPLLVVSLQKMQQLQGEADAKVTRLVIFCLEFFLRYLCVAGVVESWCILCDLNGTSLSSFPLPLLLKLIQLIQGAYRGRLYRFYILYAPRLLQFVAKPLVAALPATTAKKLRVYTHPDEWNQERRMQFASHQLEQKFGGTAPNITENWYPFRFFPGPFNAEDSADSSSGSGAAVRWESERALHTKVHPLVHTGTSLHTSLLRLSLDEQQAGASNPTEAPVLRYAAWLQHLPQLSLASSTTRWASEMLRTSLREHHDYLLQHLIGGSHQHSEGPSHREPAAGAIQSLFAEEESGALVTGDWGMSLNICSAVDGSEIASTSVELPAVPPYGALAPVPDQCGRTPRCSTFRAAEQIPAVALPWKNPNVVQGSAEDKWCIPVAAAVRREVSPGFRTGAPRLPATISEIALHASTPSVQAISAESLSHCKPVPAAPPVSPTPASSTLATTSVSSSTLSGYLRGASLRRQARYLQTEAPTFAERTGSAVASSEPWPSGGFLSGQRRISSADIGKLAGSFTALASDGSANAHSGSSGHFWQVQQPSLSVRETAASAAACRVSTLADSSPKVTGVCWESPVCRTRRASQANEVSGYLPSSQSRAVFLTQPDSPPRSTSSLSVVSLTTSARSENHRANGEEKATSRPLSSGALQNRGATFKCSEAICFWEGGGSPSVAQRDSRDLPAERRSELRRLESPVRQRLSKREMGSLTPNADPTFLDSVETKVKDTGSATSDIARQARTRRVLARSLTVPSDGGPEESPLRTRAAALSLPPVKGRAAFCGRVCSTLAPLVHGRRLLSGPMDVSAVMRALSGNKVKEMRKLKFSLRAFRPQPIDEVALHQQQSEARDFFEDSYARLSYLKEKEVSSFAARGCKSLVSLRRVTWPGKVSSQQFERRQRGPPSCEFSGDLIGSRCVAPVSQKFLVKGSAQQNPSPESRRTGHGFLVEQNNPSCPHEVGLQREESHRTSVRPRFSATQQHSRPPDSGRGPGRAAGRLLPLLFFAAAAVPLPPAAGAAAGLPLPVNSAACTATQRSTCVFAPMSLYRLVTRDKAATTRLQRSGAFAVAEVGNLVDLHRREGLPGPYAGCSLKRPCFFIFKAEGFKTCWLSLANHSARNGCISSFSLVGSKGEHSFFEADASSVPMATRVAPHLCVNCAVPAYNQQVKLNWLPALYTLFMRRAVRVAAVKPKSRGSIDKRFKVTGSGKLLYKRPGLQHHAHTKSASRRTRLRRVAVLKPSQVSRLLGPLSIRP